MAWKLGVRGPDPEELRLVSAAADAVAEGFVRTLDLEAIGEPVLGVVLDVYWDGSDVGQMAPPAVVVHRRQLTWCEEHDELDVLWCPYEPGHFGLHVDSSQIVDDAPEIKAACEALLEFAEGPLAHDPVDAYFRALADRLHQSLGVLVLYNGLGESIGEQIVAQLSPDDLATWTARGWLGYSPRGDGEGWEILVEAPVGNAIAAIYRRDGGLVPKATRALPPQTYDRSVTETLAVIGDDPAICVGTLPPGATSVEVQDLFDEWHHAEVGDGVWLCVLPHRHRHMAGLPAARFRDAHGQVVHDLTSDDGWTWDVITASAPAGADVPSLDDLRPERLQEDRLVIERARAPALWPSDWPETPFLAGCSGSDTRAKGLTLAASTIHVECRLDDDGMGIDDPGEAARDALEHVLMPRVGVRDAARAVVTATVEPFEVVVEGAPQTFAAVRADTAWAAVWVDRRAQLEVVMTGTGTRPQGLSLRPFDTGADPLAAPWDFAR